MTEIQHLQQVILSIIKDIDALCRENGISYYLLGGSAIGAIRHKGFIPWDDDLDIIMTNENYTRFIEVCRGQLNPDKYCLQVGIEDWPMNFSKVRLKGTCIREFDEYVPASGCRGIYVDVFKMDEVAGNPLIGRFQYFCAKYYLCYQLSRRKYGDASLKKKLMIWASFPLRVELLRRFCIRQIEKYNGRETPYWGFFYGRTRWKSAVISKVVYGKPCDVPFEDTMLPVPEHYHQYLTQVFGDYMKLPPIELQVGLHVISIDFGKY